MSVFIGYPSFMAYQMMKGNNDGFPSIPGMIARYSAKGLTNEEMSENPVWKDLMGNGHDLQMKNFAWGGMSGVGGYKYNFLSNDWSVDVNQVSVAFSHKIVIFNKRTSIQLVKWIRNELEKYPFNITLKVTGLEANGSSFKIYDNVGSSHALRYTKDGIYQINYTATEGANRIYFYVASGNMGQLENPITIEQLPLYPGALVFDGVDDYGICENFPILTKEKGYTVVALRKWLTPENKTNNEVLVANLKEPRWETEAWGAWGAFGCEIKYNNTNPKIVRTLSFGKMPVINVNENNVLLCQTSNNYNGVDIASGNDTGGPYLLICSRGGSLFANAAIWELIILDHDATEEELAKIKDYFVKTYPWLFPDQAWTVVGKTNEDEDRATIANITSNGNDLVLSNFGFAEGSGYGLYKTPFELYPSVQHSSKYSLSFSKFALGDHNLIIAPKQNDLSYDIKVKVTGLKDGVKFKWGWIGTTGYIDITTDGIHMLNKPASQIRQLLVEFAEDFDPDHVVTIEQIPEYEGYLVTDGVDDEVRSAAFTLNEDWTIVGNWEFITNENKNAGLTKVYSLYLYNRDYGIFVYKYINAGQGFSVEDVKSLKAICSDGRIYLNDWQEIRNNIEQEATISKGVMAIGYFNRDFTKMAFKNLGIYNNQLLSKDDCIKAYNYLQTLKAK